MTCISNAHDIAGDVDAAGGRRIADGAGELELKGHTIQQHLSMKSSY